MTSSPRSCVAWPASILSPTTRPETKTMPRPMRLGLLSVIICATALAGGCSFAGSDEPQRTEEVEGAITPAPEGKPPPGSNVILFLTDDQNVGDLEVMPNVERTLVDKGVTFSESFVNFPLCCPARATALTGQYAHNHGVLGNHLPEGGYGRLDSDDTLPVWLTEAGYRTAYMGKYMQGVRYKIPPGWQTWQTKGGPTEYNYFDYTLNQDGELVEHGSEPRDHSDAVISRKAMQYVDRYGPGRRPFFLMLGYSAPHVRGGTDRGCGPEPAPRDEGAFEREQFPRSPSFNEPDTADKPQKIRGAAIKREVREKVIARWRCRLESLLEVDRGVGRIVRALGRADSLRDTYV